MYEELVIDLLFNNSVQFLIYTSESAHFVRVAWGERAKHLEVRLCFLGATGI
jgi:hypothetical protein